MDALFNRLQHHAELSADTRRRLEALPHRLLHCRRHTDLIREGQKLGEIYILQKGWAMRRRILEDGRRQILNFLIPGDLLDLQALVDSPSDHGVSALTMCEVRAIPTAVFLRAATADPCFTAALWWTEVQEEAILREQIVRVGRRRAIERVAHLILELQRRLVVAGEAPDFTGAALPLTRNQLADALGLSSVHVSRTVSLLRRMGLVRTAEGVLAVEDQESLISVAGFDARYLHLDARPLPVMSQRAERSA